jgi:hypothetical protein
MDFFKDAARIASNPIAMKNETWDYDEQDRGGLADECDASATEIENVV